MIQRDASFYRLKAGHADLIERCGGQKRAGGLIGLSQPMMSYLGQRDHGALLSIPAKLALERDCGQPVVTRIEAELLGYRLEPIERATAHADGTPFDAHAAVMAEVGDLCGSFSRAVADGHYSRTDAATCGRDLAELRLAIERFERVNAATHAGSLAAAPP